MKEVSRVFKGLSGKWQECLKTVSRVFPVRFKGISSSFKDYLKEVKNVCLGKF